MKRKILITGGAGFVPSSLADRLLLDPESYIVAVDNLLTGDVSKLADATLPNYKFIKCDVNRYDDIAAVMLSYRFDYVFHYAAVVGVARTIANPVMVLDDIDGFKNILSLAKHTGVKRVFFSSSSEVYGEPVHLPQHEHQTPLNSRLPYAVVKNVGEAFCRSYQQEFGLDYTIFRFFNTFGPKQSTDFVMSKFIRASIQNQDITIYGNGSQTRTFCYINDNIDACCNAFFNDLFVNDVVNIGNDEAITILELANKIIKLTNSKSKIIHVEPLKEGDMSRRQPDITNMKALLNRPFTTLEEGIRNVLASGSFGYLAINQTEEVTL